MDEEKRKDPEYFLQLAKEEENYEELTKKGKLKIFFGYVAGVGKTYRMLKEAISLQEKGENIIAGYVETHGRKETEELFKKIKSFPNKKIDYNGIILEEMDLDGLLNLKPKIVLVDELAHTNAPNSRNSKRYEDVEELLNEGIDVYTCINVQHVESINDKIFHITGITVKETVPDRILKNADKIELVDLPSDELQERLKEGKVYVPEKAKTAAREFFKPYNLMELRELALRYTASQIENEITEYKATHKGFMSAGSKLLVCVTGSPSSKELIRIAKTYAEELKSQWFAVYVESPRQEVRSKFSNKGLDENLNLAEELGADIVKLSGINISEEISKFAGSKNVRLIIAGYSQRSRLQEIIKGSVLEDIVKRSYPIQVLIATGDNKKNNAQNNDINNSDNTNSTNKSNDKKIKNILFSLLANFIISTIVSLVLFLLKDYLLISDIVLFYVIPIIFSSIIFGLSGGITSSIISVLEFNFLFTYPYFSFMISDIRLVITFIILLFTGIVTSMLVSIVKRQENEAKARINFLTSLYDFSKTLLKSKNYAGMMQSIVENVAELFESEVHILVSHNNKLSLESSSKGASVLSSHDMEIAEWGYERIKRVGLGTNTFAATNTAFIPLKVKEDIALGVIAITPKNKKNFLIYENNRLLESFINIVSMAMSNFYEMML